jgi:hypothetical protein
MQVAEPEPADNRRKICQQMPGEICFPFHGDVLTRLALKALIDKTSPDIA